MKKLLIASLVLVYACVLTGCAASNAEEEGVKDHQNHEEYYKPTSTGDGSPMAAKMTPTVAN